MKKFSYSDVWAMDKDHFIHPYTDFSTFNAEGSQIITQAQGAYITDSDNKRFLDGIAGLWCVNIGHGRKEMADTIFDQVMQMQYYNPFGHTTNVPGAVLASKLAELTPGDLNHVYYTTGGSTANDSAIRMIHYFNNMRGMPNKKKIISRVDAYHGSTCIAANLTGIHATKVKFDRIGDDFVHHISSANCYRRPAGMSEELYCDHLLREFEDRILQLGADNVAAFIAEPLMGAGGVLVAPSGYHKRMKAVCEKYDMLYVADEVVTAFGRLGSMVSSQDLFDCTPDILVLAKGITSGYIPLGAVVISSGMYEVLNKPQSDAAVFSMGFTYAGHAVACAAALKNIEIMERENLCEHVKDVGPYLQRKATEELAELPMVGDVRGSHFMLGIELVQDKKSKQGFSDSFVSANRIFKRCLEAGVVIRPIGNMVVISPPLTVNQQQCDDIVLAVKEAVVKTSSEIK